MQMPSPAPTVWPASRDYVEAIQNPRSSFFEPDLADLIPAVDKFGMPIVSSGQFAYVFKLNSPAQRISVAVRCFRGFEADRHRRYRAIDSFLNTVNLPALAKFEYTKDGIGIHGKRYPILVMDWISGATLDVFVGDVVGKRDVLLHLADQWLKLVAGLRQASIAHGDLQHGNVIVRNGDLHLVDFDGMYVPEMADMQAAELGHRHYQHPRRDETFFDGRLDNFSTLVIYLSLLALADQPSLWDSYHDENLIFRKSDYCDPDRSVLLRSVARLGGNCTRLASVLKEACKADPQDCPFLGDFVAARSKLPGWMTAPPDVPTQSRTREAASATVPNTGTYAPTTPPNWQSTAGSGSSLGGNANINLRAGTILNTRRNILSKAGGVFGSLLRKLFGPAGPTAPQTSGAPGTPSGSVPSGSINHKYPPLHRPSARWTGSQFPPSGAGSARPTRTATTIPPSKSSTHPVVGSSIRMIYHRPGCEWAKRISYRNRIEFVSAAEARARHLRPCRVCSP